MMLPSSRILFSEKLWVCNGCRRTTLAQCKNDFYQVHTSRIDSWFILPCSGLLLRKVHIFWEGHKICEIFILLMSYVVPCQSKVRCRFRKILRPSQNMWTLTKRCTKCIKLVEWHKKWAKKVDQDWEKSTRLPVFMALGVVHKLFWQSFAHT